MRPTPARTILLFLALPLWAIAAQSADAPGLPVYRIDAPADLNAADLEGNLIGTVRVSNQVTPGSPDPPFFWLEGAGAVQVHPRDEVLFLGGLAGEFSLEFWLYPATVDEGTRILHWQGRHPMSGELQRMSLTVSRQRLLFSASGLLRDRDGDTRDIQLLPWGPLLPRTWSHHEIGFDADSGTLVYRVDGVVEAVATGLSRADFGSTIDGLVFGEGYRGLLDGIRFSALSPDLNRPRNDVGQ